MEPGHLVSLAEEFGEFGLTQEGRQSPLGQPGMWEWWIWADSGGAVEPGVGDIVSPELRNLGVGLTPEIGQREFCQPD